METSASTSAKRQRPTSDTVGVGVSRFLYGPPRRFSASNLFDPTVVTIEVCDEEDAFEPEWTESFAVPLELLSTQSPYFSRLFERGFAESVSGSATLSDVSPWVFRVFITWLYRGIIFYEADRQPRRFFTNADDSGTTTAGVSNVPTIDLTSDEDEHPSKRQKTSTSTASKSRISRAQEKLSEANSSPPKYTGPRTHHIPGGYVTKFIQQDIIAYGSHGSTDECNYREPTSWAWSWLIDLYTFADKYDIRAFRMKLFEIMQLKCFMVLPRRYNLPIPASTAAVADRLMPSSPLYRMLADSWGTCVGLAQLGGTVEQQAQEMDQLPPQFLSRSLIASRRAESAACCKKCRTGGSGEQCEDTDHTKEDALSPYQKGSCFYHEHGEDAEEKEQCQERWAELIPPGCLYQPRW